ncbi:putative disease resistance RPP13-like protein 3 [Triticum dicoccoides]|uniref:putative disease resistance RPP13-like protein 3 n=1 Tax=Triticum dicoccoides TaxID=85692 RepID=UPI000E7AF1F0|nr:putative disease resistance RPP13-like protein 3 [Triticum dicoccoides]XP_037423682.1 putative disease resistance RPP13-like protein 3 [Triticum dicoccoides]
MAETVVSMARSMLGGAISMAATAAATEMSLLLGVRKDIWFIKDELKMMQAFLVAAEKTKNKNMLLKVWAEQVRDLAYGIENCLDEFMVHVGSQSRSRRLLKLKDRYRIASQIRDLKARVEEVSNRNARYNLINTDTSSNIDEVNASMEDVRSHSAGNIDEAELVGFVKPKEELIKMVDVNSRDGLSKVICVVGMGGLGKTTLARKAYDSKEDIVNKFACCAWVTVSQSFSKIEMLKEMISQLLGTESLTKCLKELEQKAVQVEHLANYLREKLEDKRYFIVLDDLWTIDAWNWIKFIAFPIRNNKGSRIIVTTRDVGLAAQCTSESLIYHLKHLQIEDATNLLLRKSGKKREDMKNDKKMMAVVKKIVKKCGGLPLAILTIGGMLGNKKAAEWESIYTQIPSELESNPSLEAMRRIVTLSYNNLPSHLKSCFLYLSIFPEDFEIKRRRLVDRWIAEGLVRARAGVNIEDVGISYFIELINRSMIQPSKVSIEGHVKSCRVHDIMRDVMVSISREENFVYLAGDNATTVAEGNFRHVAYHGSKCPKLGVDCSHVRSLTMFGERSMEPSNSLFPSKLRMLRALDLEDGHFVVRQKDINNIVSLRHLKYVTLRPRYLCLNMHKLPASIGKLQGLQSLDLGYSCITTLPTEIGKLEGLRTLRCRNQRYSNYFDQEDGCERWCNIVCMPLVLASDHALRAEFFAELPMMCTTGFGLPKSHGVKFPKGISNLKELQILEYVDIKRTSSRAIEELGELTQLKKLRVTTKGATEEKCKLFWKAIGKLSYLYSLRVDGEDLKWLASVHFAPPLLRNLKLYGYPAEIPEMPNWVGSLMHLVKIKFFWNGLKVEERTMEMLGALPNLMLLDIIVDFIVVQKLVFVAEAFPSLRILDMQFKHGLSEVKFEEGTLPHIAEIKMGWGTPSVGIVGIKHLPKIKDIEFRGSGQVARLGVLQGEVNSHPNRPVLRVSNQNLGDAVVQVEESSTVLSDQAAAAGGSDSEVDLR